MADMTDLAGSVLVVAAALGFFADRLRIESFLYDRSPANASASDRASTGTVDSQATCAGCARARLATVNTGVAVGTDIAGETFVGIRFGLSTCLIATGRGYSLDSRPSTRFLGVVAAAYLGSCWSFAFLHILVEVQCICFRGPCARLVPRSSTDSVARSPADSPAHAPSPPIGLPSWHGCP